jgi:hypothetical protein
MREHNAVIGFCSRIGSDTEPKREQNGERA